MSNKLLKNVLIVLGLLMIVAGLVIMAVILPMMRVFPDDVDTTRTYDVASLVMLNPADMSFIVSEDGAGVNITRNVFVEEVDGNNTLVRETQTLTMGDTPLMNLVKRHTLDRASMTFLDSPPTAWTETEGYWERDGIVIGWGPEGVEKRNYVAWSDDYRDNVDMVYVEEQERGGINTYYFTSTYEAQPIDPAAVAAMGLPPVLPMEAFEALAAGLEIEDMLVKLFVNTALPGMVETAVRETQELGEDDPVLIPLAYTYEYFGEYWAEPTSGVLIDTHKVESRGVTFAPEVLANLAGQLEAIGRDPEALGAILPVTVYGMEYTADEASVAAARADAEDARDTINLYGTTVPMVLIALGLAATILGLGMIFFDTPKKEEEG
jgi:hypothetical protein